jgi:hypothetical protein
VVGTKEELKRRINYLEGELQKWKRLAELERQVRKLQKISKEMERSEKNG